MSLLKNKNKIRRERDGKSNFTATGERREQPQRQITNKDQGSLRKCLRNGALRSGVLSHRCRGWGGRSFPLIGVHLHLDHAAGPSGLFLFPQSPFRVITFSSGAMG